MIYSYSKINFIGGTSFLGETYLKPINGRIDNKMAVFFKSMSPKVESLKQTEKNLRLEPLERKYSDLIEEIDCKSNELQLPKEHLCNGRMKF